VSKTVVCLKYFLEFVPGELTVSEDLSKESAPDRLTLVHGYNRAPPVWMPQEMMTSPCANDFKTKFPKGFDKLGTSDGRKCTHEETATR
jgi:hypothetical protein